MKRFFVLVLNEFKLIRAAVPPHIVAVILPIGLYFLMGSVLVTPLMRMNLQRSTTTAGQSLETAMRSIGSPIGDRYIDLHLVEQSEPKNLRQVIVVEEENGTAVAVQRYGLIDANQVKNLRNRLTAAALRLWTAKLDGHAVTIEEHPWLPRDYPYKFYFGMAMLPLAMFLAAVIPGSVLTAQGFEFGTVQEERLAPASIVLPVMARITRLTLFAYLPVTLLFIVSGYMTGFWPTSIWPVVLALLPVGIIGAGVGILLGLIFQNSITVYVLSMALSITLWLFGNNFSLTYYGGLAARLTQFSPNTYAVYLIFPHFFGSQVTVPQTLSALLLTLGVVGAVLAALLTYRSRVRYGH